MHMQHIMVISPNSEEGALVEASLRDDFDVHTYASADAAMDMLLSNIALPDLILLELDTLCADGSITLSAIKKNRLLKEIPLISIVTADCEVEALAMGAEDYMRKPLHKESILLRVKNMLLMKSHEAHEASIVSHDSMTGLLSRNTFDRDMDRLSAENLQGVGMVLLDLNNLKEMNDTCGHKCGDEVIRISAMYVRQVFSGIGRCYRIGGDEFLVLTQDVPLSQIRQKVAAFNMQSGRFHRLWEAQDGKPEATLVVDAAIGYALFTPGLDTGPHSLFTRVDDKMYANKRAQKNRTQLRVQGKEPVAMPARQ